MLQLRKIHIAVPNRDGDPYVWELSADLLVVLPFRQLLDQFTSSLAYEALRLRIQNITMTMYVSQDRRRNYYFFVKVSDRLLPGELLGQFNSFIIVHCKKPLIEPGFQ